MRRAARVDANHAVIKAEFLSLGASVFDASAVGGGFTDLVVGFVDRRSGSATYGNAVNKLIEVKTEKGKKRKTQTDFALGWRGDPPIVVRTVEDVRWLMGVDLKVA